MSTLTAPAPVIGALAAAPPPNITVIVPVTERPHPPLELYREFVAPLRAMGRSVEFVFAVESYYRALADPVAALAAQGESVRVFVAGQTVGEAALLRAAAAHSRGTLLITLPAYPRVSAESLPDLVQAIDAGADLVVAYRNPRNDGLVNRVQSRVFNAFVGRLIGHRMRDIACGVRVMRPEVLRETPLYGDFFRFLPVLAAREGFKVVEAPAAQHPADCRTRVFGPGVYLRRVIDAFGLFFLLRFTEKPLRFFGLAGSVSTLLGAVVLLILFLQRIGGQGIANRPLLLLGVVLVVLGVQVIALGLVGEIIVHLNASDRRPYRLARDPGVPLSPPGHSP